MPTVADHSNVDDECSSQLYLPGLADEIGLGDVASTHDPPDTLSEQVDLLALLTLLPMGKSLEITVGRFLEPVEESDEDCLTGHLFLLGLSGRLTGDLAACRLFCISREDKR